MLIIEKVNYTYKTQAGPVHALKDVSATFENGKFYAITGRSGSGKTTLVSLIAGLDIPDDGEIRLDEINLKDIDKNRFRREKMGIIFQTYHLLPQFTAAENIEMVLDLNKISKNEKKEKIDNLLKAVGLTEFHGKKRPLQLSGGEQQRVAIARSIAANPDIIIGDEPTGNLDNENGRNIIKILKSLAHDKNKCVIVVTHADEVSDEADVVYKMIDGKLS